jgi:hypothetical protein
MNSMWSKKWVQILVFVITFAVVPAAIYWYGIRLPYQQLLNVEKQMSSEPAMPSAESLGVIPASMEEQQLLTSVQSRFLGRVKRIATMEELTRFSGILADALAEEARQQGLRIESVEMSGNPVKGQYLPINANARQQLAHWPGLAGTLPAAPSQIASLQLPCQEWQMTVSADYSKLFQFIDSLAQFPALVSLVDVSTETGPRATNYRLKVRGYYWSTLPVPAQGT